MAGLKFRRQQPIGKYIVDFVCFENRIIIEVDGGKPRGCLSLKALQGIQTLAPAYLHHSHIQK